jgi:hypothetical protein
MSAGTRPYPPARPKSEELAELLLDQAAKARRALKEAGPDGAAPGVQIALLEAARQMEFAAGAVAMLSREQIETHREIDSMIRAGMRALAGSDDD